MTPSKILLALLTATNAKYSDSYSFTARRGMAIYAQSQDETGLLIVA
jgi:hypothetical protein